MNGTVPCMTKSGKFLSNDWRWAKLGDICKQDRTIVEPQSESSRGLPYLGLEDIESNTGRILSRPDIRSSESVQSTTFLFTPQHVLYGKLRPYLNKVAVPDFRGRCSTELIPLLPHVGISRNYLAWLLRRPVAIEAAMREKTGSRMPRADMQHVLSLQIPIPRSFELQEQLADELKRQMDIIFNARQSIQEQLHLLDSLGL
ncbi:MAG TPA: restriction endonuclease subunit S, partial [Elusimicrobiales bacterium]|nr:restriction endonuclease subunit S [Elusimicrobiales bacterium]